MKSTRSLISFPLLASMIGSGQAQTGSKASHPEFEVASVRVSKESTAEPLVRIAPGRFNVENMPLRRLIFVAYRLRDFQISSGPSWINSQRYNIEAETNGHDGSDTMLLMLEGLLEDRFHLRYHHETRSGPVYLLTTAKRGSKMQAASCVPFDPNNLLKQSQLSAQERNRQCGGISRSAGALDGNGMSMEDAAGPAFQSLAGQLSLVLDRPVINRTGLTGRFDVHLRWNGDQAMIGSPSNADDPISPPNPTDQTGPSIFTAVQEQLGLKLDAGKSPVDNFVIDHVEKPNEN